MRTFYAPDWRGPNEAESRFVDWMPVWVGKAQEDSELVSHRAPRS